MIIQFHKLLEHRVMQSSEDSRNSPSVVVFDDRTTCSRPLAWVQTVDFS